jgi:hypothetical protein
MTMNHFLLWIFAVVYIITTVIASGIGNWLAFRKQKKIKLPRQFACGLCYMIYNWHQNPDGTESIPYWSRDGAGIPVCEDCHKAGA